MNETRRQQLPPRDRRRAPRESVHEALEHQLTKADVTDLAVRNWPGLDEPAVAPYASSYIAGQEKSKLGDLINERKAL